VYGFQNYHVKFLRFSETTFANYFLSLVSYFLHSFKTKHLYADYKFEMGFALYKNKIYTNKILNKTMKDKNGLTQHKFLKLDKSIFIIFKCVIYILYIEIKFVITKIYTISS
jgi:hypothetical protein